MTRLPPVMAWVGGDSPAARDWVRDALARVCPVSPGERIALKPNLGSPLPARTGATTELWLIRAAIEHVLDSGGKPVVVEGPSHIHDFEQVLQGTGADRLSKQLGVPIVDARSDVVPIPREGRRTLLVSRVAMEADAILSLPKLKTHNRTGVTMCLKNFMGLLGFADRHGFHKRGVHEDVADLYERLRPRLRGGLIDGITAMEGHGPTQGTPVALGVLLAAADPWQLDALGARVMGFDPARVKHLELARRAGLGIESAPPMEIRPEGDVLPSRQFERARFDSGLRTAVITFPPLSAALRSVRFGVRGRRQPRMEPVPRCDSCDACERVCPSAAAMPGRAIDPLACIACGLCLPACPEHAIRLETPWEKRVRVAGVLASGLLRSVNRPRGEATGHLNAAPRPPEP